MCLPCVICGSYVTKINVVFWPTARGRHSRRFAWLLSCLRSHLLCAYCNFKEKKRTRLLYLGQDQIKTNTRNKTRKEKLLTLCSLTLIVFSLHPLRSGQVTFNCARLSMCSHSFSNLLMTTLIQSPLFSKQDSYFYSHYANRYFCVTFYGSVITDS